jgi:hypothetical protein
MESPFASAFMMRCRIAKGQSFALWRLAWDGLAAEAVQGSKIA